MFNVNTKVLTFIVLSKQSDVCLSTFFFNLTFNLHVINSFINNIKTSARWWTLYKNMGMYTELLLKCSVKENLSLKTKNILDFLFNDKEEPDDLPDHDFFKCERWKSIGRCNSYYHIPYTLNYYKEGYLFSRSDLKNYNNEIGLFLEWIDPYINGLEESCIGWIWYEENFEPTLIYKKQDTL